MNKELKPCPFCGGKAIFKTTSNRASHSEIGFTFKIRCEKCGVETPRHYESDVYLLADGTIQPGKRDERYKAIEDWSRRSDNAID